MPKKAQTVRNVHQGHDVHGRHARTSLKLSRTAIGLRVWLDGNHAVTRARGQAGGASQTRAVARGQARAAARGATGRLARCARGKRHGTNGQPSRLCVLTLGIGSAWTSTQKCVQSQEHPEMVTASNMSYTKSNILEFVMT